MSFTPNEEILKAYGPSSDEECLVLFHNVLMSELYNYVCSENIAKLMEFRITLKNLSDKIIDVEEDILAVKRITDDYKGKTD